MPLKAKPMISSIAMTALVKQVIDWYEDQNQDRYCDFNVGYGTQRKLELSLCRYRILPSGLYLQHAAPHHCPNTMLVVQRIIATPTGRGIATQFLDILEPCMNGQFLLMQATEHEHFKSLLRKRDFIAHDEGQSWIKYYPPVGR